MCIIPGPPVNVVEQYSLRKCIVGADHIGDDELPMVSSESCASYGMLIEDFESDKLKLYQSYDVIFFVALPVKRTERKMLRLYQYLIVDIDVSLRSEYIKKLTGTCVNLIVSSMYCNCLSPEEYDHQLLEYHVSLGYRDGDTRHWSRLATGNASRLLDCSLSHWVSRSIGYWS